MGNSYGMFQGWVIGFRNFLRYLSSAWGLLSISTPLFPLIDGFTRLMPMPEAHGELFNVVAFLCGAFVIMYEYTIRDNSDYEREKKAGLLFLLAVVLIIIYPVVLFPNYGSFEEIKELDEVRFIIEPIIYVAVYYLLTRSFTLLAIVELRKWEKS